MANTRIPWHHRSWVADEDVEAGQQLELVPGSAELVRVHTGDDGAFWCGTAVTSAAAGSAVTGQYGGEVRALISTQVGAIPTALKPGAGGALVEQAVAGGPVCAVALELTAAVDQVARVMLEPTLRPFWA